jgi:hypothetical protein
MILTGEIQGTEKKNSSATFSTTNPTLTGLELNPATRVDRPVTNRLSPDTAYWKGGACHFTSVGYNGCSIYDCRPVSKFDTQLHKSFIINS